MKKHSLMIMGHKTSLALEPVFWNLLRETAKKQGLSATALVTKIDSQRSPKETLASALRVYLVTDLIHRTGSF